MSLLDDVKSLATTSQSYLQVGSSAVSTTFTSIQTTVRTGLNSILPGNLLQSIPTAAQKQADLEALALKNQAEGGPLDTKKANVKISNKTNTAQFKGRLQSKLNGLDKIYFRVTPTVDESRQAIYDALQPVHHPGAIQVYKTTGPRTFAIGCKFIAQTQDDADEVLKNLEIIRSWVMPYYGLGTAENIRTKNYLGAPPDILEFSLYGERTYDRLPVILKSYQWSMPDSVDYIPDSDGNPCPTIIEVHLTLEEAWTPEQFMNFSLYDYKNGTVRLAFGDFSTNPPEERTDAEIQSSKDLGDAQ